MKAGAAATRMPRAGSCRLALSMKSTPSGRKLVVFGKPCAEGDMIEYLANASRLLVAKLQNSGELAPAF